MGNALFGTLVGSVIFLEVGYIVILDRDKGLHRRDVRCNLPELFGRGVQQCIVILEYIKSVVHSDRRMRKWSAEDKQLVISALSDKADGM